MKQYVFAIKSYDKALHVDPHDLRVWLGKGNALVGLGHGELAIQVYDQILSVDKDNVRALANKQIVLGGMGRSQKPDEPMPATIISKL